MTLKDYACGHPRRVALSPLFPLGFMSLESVTKSLDGYTWLSDLWELGFLATHLLLTQKEVRMEQNALASSTWSALPEANEFLQQC